MRIERRYTKEGQSPYADIEFRLTTSEIRNPDGSVVFHADNVEVPSFWSQVAADVLAQKYFRKAGVPARLKKVEEETVPSWLWRSVPDEEALEALPEKERIDRRALRQAGVRPARRHLDLLGLEGRLFRLRGGRARLLRRARATCWRCRWRRRTRRNGSTPACTGPTASTGRARAISTSTSETGKLVKSKSAYEHPQPHACFIQSINDDLVNEGGIMDLWVREARLFKYGSGTGTNFSRLRGEGERLAGGGKSSGLMSFLKIGDRAAGAIKSGGTTRRAAKMVIVDTDHPDIEQFIDWKVTEEQKVASLVTGSKINQKHLRAILKACVNCEGSGDDCFDPEKNPVLRREIKAARKNHVPDNYIQRVIQFAKQGYTDIHFPIYDTDWDSEAYLTVSGQNSNNSVRVTDEFLKAVESDGDWDLTWRTKPGKIAKTLKARDLWEKIGHAAWACADPGLQYHTTVNDWHTCPASGPIRASNPCSEYMFLDDTACNLASLNLLGVPQRQDPRVRRRGLRARHPAVDRRARNLGADGAVPVAARSRKLSYEFRTLGLGYANLGGLLMSSGISYDSDAGRQIAGALTAIMTGVSYATSAEMAGELGPFPGYKKNREHMLRVIRNHRRAAHGERTGYEKVATPPVPLDHKACPDPRRMVEHAKARLGPRARARRAARLPQRAGLGDRADRHHRPGDGLRHHRHRARLRAGEVQEARRRRLLQDHQPRGAGGAARARLLAKRRSPRSRPMRSATATLAQAPGINHSTLQAEGLLAGSDREGREGAADRLRHQVRVQQVDAGRGVLRHSSASRPRSSPTRASTCSPRSASPSARSRPPTSTSAAP